MTNWNIKNKGNFSNHVRDQPILIDDNPWITFVPGKLYLLPGGTSYSHIVQQGANPGANRKNPCLLSRATRKHIIGLDISNLGMFMNYTFTIHEDYIGSMVAPVIQTPVFSISGVLYVPDLTYSALYATQNVESYLENCKPFVHHPDPDQPAPGVVYTLDDCIGEVEKL